MRKFFTLALLAILCGCSSNNVDSNKDLVNSRSTEQESLTIKQFNNELKMPMTGQNDEYYFKDTTVNFSVKPTKLTKKDDCHTVEGIYNESLGHPQEGSAIICGVQLKENHEHEITGVIEGLQAIDSEDLKDAMLIIKGNK